MPADAGPAAEQAAADSDSNADKNDVPSGGRDNGELRAVIPAGGDRVIADERAHLKRSREFLHLMRENVLALAQNPMAGNRVSLEYLKADLYRRAEALKDLPDAPLFFGRLDYSELAKADEDFAGADFHIGRRHVHDKDGTPVVLDWRAPVSRPFYRASQADPMGLTLRRRFGFAGGGLTAYEDERFSLSGETRTRSDESEAQPTSNLLISEIERPRSGPMRDIVATIQPEQDDIVRAGAATTVCVQGAPGTGKTAVGLHRVAFLLYAHKEQMIRRGVIVVGPNLAFLSYIRNVLPALGELDVTQTTVADWSPPLPSRPQTPARPRSSRATPAWRRCCVTPCGRTSRHLRKRSSSAAARVGCACPRTRSKRSRESSATVASATGPAVKCSPTASRTCCSPSSKRPARRATTAPTTPFADPRRYVSASTRSGRRLIRRSLFSPFSPIKIN